MNRRRFLTKSGAGTVAGFAGCLGSGGGTDEPTAPLDVDGSEPTLTFAEESSLTLEATQTGRVTVVLPDPEFIAFRFRNADWSPEPTRTTDSYPPHWVWSSAQSVSGTVPIQIGDHAEAGEYTYEVKAFAGSDADARATVESFSITISGN